MLEHSPFFHTCSTFLFTTQPTIQRYIVSDADSILVNIPKDIFSPLTATMYLTGFEDLAAS